MADEKKRLPNNVEGEFFVDSTCLNCDTCRQIAPTVFGADGKYAIVVAQPVTAEEKRKSIQAVLCCPNGSIGLKDRSAVKDVMADFPLLIEEDVYFTGFNSMKTAGANSYFVKSDAGNWLICSPKFQGQLVGNIEKLGGLKYMFLSHRDDVGEALKFREKFGCALIIHETELDALPEAQVVIRGAEPFAVTEDFIVIPASGHTQGHCFLLYRGKYLFGGDTLHYDRNNKRINIWGPDWTWFDYRAQADSVERLLNYHFQWVLPSHGWRAKLPEAEMHEQVKAAVERSRQVQDADPVTKYRLKVLEYYARTLHEVHQDKFAEVIEAKIELLRSKLSATV
jgi:glyoxylase-like metal-dependent hydrolase (beta-lactamase superfamily II)/ferredoxin